MISALAQLALELGVLCGVGSWVLGRMAGRVDEFEHVAARAATYFVVGVFQCLIYGGSIAAFTLQMFPGLDISSLEVRKTQLIYFGMVELLLMIMAFAFWKGFGQVTGKSLD